MARRTTAREIGGGGGSIAMAFDTVKPSCSSSQRASSVRRSRPSMISKACRAKLHRHAVALAAVAALHVTRHDGHGGQARSLSKSTHRVGINLPLSAV